MYSGSTLRWNCSPKIWSPTRTADTGKHSYPDVSVRTHVSGSRVTINSYIFRRPRVSECDPTARLREHGRDEDGLSFAMSQASCLNSIARIYAPFYRAATFVAEDKQAAWRLAYQDVRQAFSCYLEKYASHRIK